MNNMRFISKSELESAYSIGCDFVIWGLPQKRLAQIDYFDFFRRFEKQAMYIVDSNKALQGKRTQLIYEFLDILAPEVLLADLKSKPNIVVLINIFSYAVENVLEILSTVNVVVNLKLYYVPMVLSWERHLDIPNHILASRCETEQIPKRIHYCWFGKNAMHPKLLECIASWKKYCPDYEIIRWDEDSYDVSTNEYVSGAYQSKKYEFVSDYVRLDVLYNYGGIYMDTDVELVKNIDIFLRHKAFVGMHFGNVINTGVICGTYPHNPMFKRLLDEYAGVQFITKSGDLNLRCNDYYNDATLMRNYSYSKRTSFQLVGDLAVYPSEYFAPLSGSILRCKNVRKV